MENSVSVRKAQLFDELIRDILVRLFVLELLQYRSVCKKWKVLIDSQEFQEQYAKRSSPEVCFLVFMPWQEKKKELHVYFPLSCKWKAVPISLIQPQEFTPHAAPLTSRTGLDNSTSLPVSEYYNRGLWLILPLRSADEGKRGDGTTVAVHNPLTYWYKRLPSYSDPNLRSKPPCRLVSVLINQLDRSFKVLSAGIHRRRCRTNETTCVASQLFDSVAGKWEKVSNVPFPNLRFRTDGTGEVTQAQCGSLVYYLVQKVNHHEIILLSFDLETGVWNRVAGQMPVQSSGYDHDEVFLFERHGSLVLVMRNYLLNPDFLASTWFPHLYSWDRRLSAGVQHWAKIATPNPPIDKAQHLELIRDESFLGLTWTGKGDFIFFTCGRLWGTGALVYNLSSRSWKITRFDREEHPHQGGERPCTGISVAFEIQLSAVLNYSIRCRLDALSDPLN